jgi:cytochrome c553
MSPSRVPAAIASLLAASLAALAAPVAAQDAKAGEKKTAMCAGCHNIQGYQASFPEIHRVPKISGQTAKYIANSLVAYRKGERKHPSMRAISASLSDQDIADLAAFYEQQGKEAPARTDAKVPQPKADVAALLAKANCASCHGTDFNTPIDPSYPKLGGQYADYLYVALKSYQVDGNPRVGRANPIMMGMARPFTHAELKKLADYLASLPAAVHTIQKSPFH